MGKTDEHDMSNIAVKCRIYPDPEQIILLSKTFGCVRKIYNLMLSDRIAHYKKYHGMLHCTPAQYKKEYPFLKEVDSLALANVQLHLDSAFRNFFKKLTGFPKFKSRHYSKRSYTTNNQKGSIRIENGYIRLPKLGFVRIKLHRGIDPLWVLRSATVSQEPSGEYYVSLLFEYPYTRPVLKTVISEDKVIGFDYTSDGLYMDSNGHRPENNRFYQDSMEKLAHRQRKLKHKIIGSNNYKKQIHKINKIHTKIKNQRHDFLHKESAKIANSYDCVCVEDLDMRALSNKGFGNGRSTMNNGYGMFLGMLSYKLEAQGKYLVKIDKWFPSSQLCSCCGHQNKVVKNLSIRAWECPECHTYHEDRDYNASINIRNEGIRILRENGITVVA